MITSVHSTTVIVNDQDKALEFYTEVLGWDKVQDNDFGEGGRWLTVAPKGAETAVVLGQSEMYGGLKPGSSEVGCGISLIADDVQATYDDLKAKGVEFRQAPEKMPWGATATWFSDPDGNGFFLTEDQ